MKSKEPMKAVVLVGGEEPDYITLLIPIGYKPDTIKNYFDHAHSMDTKPVHDGEQL